MLVLDYPRTTSPERPSIVLPRFHSGPLGFVPNTHVHVATPSVSPGTSPQRTEVLVTPFETTKDGAALISVVLHDTIGAVRRLVQALSWLNVNIEVQESSSIDHLDLHRVGMIVDLDGSNLPRESLTSERVQRMYRDVAANVPIHSRRFVYLFDTILAQCGDLLWWQEYARRLIPSLYVRPLPRRAELNPTSVLLKASRDQRNTEIELPGRIAHHIRRRLDLDEHSRRSVSYVFVSDTNDRTLRTFFLPESQAERIVHLGIRHADRAGTLARLLDVLAAAEFNIVTSLLRKYQERTSVWEGVLEYCGTGTPPRRPRARRQLPAWYREELLPWAHRKLSASPVLAEIAGCNVAIGPPLYPKACGGAADENWVRLSPAGRSTADPPRLTNAAVMDLLDQRESDLRGAGRDPEEHRETNRLIATVAEHRQRIRQRTLFLSYPKTARAIIANYLRPLLVQPERPSYHVTDFQNAQPPDLKEQIISAIRDADYFLAIWHPEADRAGARLMPPKISPWMLFEYGVASALEKPVVLACHEQLENIDPFRLVGLTGVVMYTDDNFALTKAAEIKEACRKVFRDEDEALFNDDPPASAAA